jgi:hypothetical protein
MAWTRAAVGMAAHSLGFHIPLLAEYGYSDNDAEKTNLSAVMETLKNASLYSAEEIKFLPNCS